VPPRNRIDEGGLYLKLVTENQLGNKLTQAIKNEPQLDCYGGSMMETGRGASRIEAQNLAAWLVRRSFIESIDRALQDVADHLAADGNGALEVLGVYGLKVKSPVPIIDGVHLVPIGSLPSPTVRAFLNPTLFLHHATPLPGMSGANAALTRTCKVRPKFSTGPDQGEIIYEGSSVKLRTLLMLFGLVEKAAPLPGFATVLANENVPCGNMFAAGGSSELVEVGMERELEVSQDHIEVVRKYLPLFEALPEPKQQTLLRAIERLSLARRRTRIEDQYLDIGIALEMLLLRDLTENDPVSLPFRLRGAWLLGSNPEERRDLERVFKSIYSFRSMAVHEGRLKTRKKGKQPNPSDFLGEAIETGCAVVKRLLELGDPDLEGLIWGAPLTSSGIGP